MAKDDNKPALKFGNIASLQDPKYWSHAASIGKSSRLVFTSGLTGELDDGTYPESFSDQVKQSFVNVEKALVAAGAAMRDVVKITFFPVDWSMEEKARPMFEPYVMAMTEKYGWLNRPLTTTVPVACLGHPLAKFEVEAVAAVPGDSVPYSAGAGGVDVSAPPVKTDVVVIGGGFSGLMAAVDCQESGLDTVLLEAKHRVGGRSRTEKLRSGPGVIELGATWINELTQPKIFALTKKFGLETLQQYETGDSIFQTADGVVHRLKDDNMETLSNIEMLMTYGQLLQELEEAYTKIDLDKPSSSPEELDLSVIDWVKSKTGDNPLAVGFATHLVAALVGRDVEEVGMQFIVDYLKSCGGVIAVGGEGKYGAQSLKLKKGTSSIAQCLADSMKTGSVQLNSPVSSILQHGETVIVETSNGNKYEARKVIIAIPSNTYDYIKFSPPLPEKKRTVVSRTMGGNYSKIILTYSKPWWREANLCGKFSSFVGPVCFSWEISDPSLKQYSIAIFVSGPSAKKWSEMNSLTREESVINHLAELVGPELATSAKDVLEVNYMEWKKEDFILGAPISSMGPGQLRLYGEALREPFLNIHIAGGETAYEWKGFLEGALRAGSRAASEVIKALKQ